MVDDASVAVRAAATPQDVDLRCRGPFRCGRCLVTTANHRDRGLIGDNGKPLFRRNIRRNRGPAQAEPCMDSNECLPSTVEEQEQQLLMQLMGLPTAFSSNGGSHGNRHEESWAEEEPCSQQDDPGSMDSGCEVEGLLHGDGKAGGAEGVEEDAAASCPMQSTPASLSEALHSSLGGSQWQQAFDPIHGAYYYYRESTQETQWEPPLEGFVPAPYEWTHDAHQSANPMEVQPLNGAEDVLEPAAAPDEQAISSSSSSKAEAGGKGSDSRCSDRLGVSGGEPSAQLPGGGVSQSELLQMKKYWYQRFSLFSRFREGIQMDEEAWYSVTPEVIAAHQARRCACGVAVDAFAGAGGNAIALGGTCKHVIAIDSCAERVELAKRNATVYNVSGVVDFICGDFFRLAPHLRHADVVFLSPPWGGPAYSQSQEFSVVSDVGGMGLGLAALVECAGNIIQRGDRNSNILQQQLPRQQQQQQLPPPCQPPSSRGVACFMPRNISLAEVSETAGAAFRGGEHEDVEVERNMLNGKLKACTLYYGSFADGGRQAVAGARNGPKAL
mmetsp:Transcript_7108/g.20055  ORF Transcript_7108/g.20055 Transcript_7108/m.20055 type:complete len:555 (-) Transcript_7108:55-1719(-)